MNFITGKYISRRTMLRGMGTAIGLPLLDAMIPAGKHLMATEAGKAADNTRLVCIEQVHGAAGCNDWGASQNLWCPADEGQNFDLFPTSLQPLEPFRKYLTIISDTDCRMADAFAPKEIGGDHFRSTAVFLTQAHPKQTQGSDLHVGTSFDQVFAQQYGHETPIPSLQMTIENVDQAGGCAYGYACAYTDTVSWAAPDKPLPMIRDPRAIFEQLFGSGGSNAQRIERLKTNSSILDWVLDEMAALQKNLGPGDQKRIDSYMENVRELEQRIQRIEAQNLSGDVRNIPAAPVGVPDDFEEHVKLMFDMQLAAFISDSTRIFSLKLGRDASPRIYDNSGSDQPFHACSHHGGSPEQVLEFAKINKYHVGMLPYFLEKLQNTMEGDSNLLDKTLLLYGSAMGDSNLHNHVKCPLFLIGGGNGILAGESHVKAPGGTPMANVFLDLLHKMNVTQISTTDGLGFPITNDLTSFGNSTGTFSVM